VEVALVESEHVLGKVQVADLPALRFVAVSNLLLSVRRHFASE